MNLRILFLLTLCANSVSLSQISMKMSYSPDTAVVVRIATVEEKGGINRESAFQFWSKAGKRLAARSFVTRDHRGGLGLIRSQWSLDSRYFLFNMMPAGGEDQGRYPVFVFSRADNTVHNLDTLLGGKIVSPLFVMENVDTVMVTIALPGGEAADTVNRLVPLDSLFRIPDAVRREGKK